MVNYTYFGLFIVLPYVCLFFFLFGLLKRVANLGIRFIRLKQPMQKEISVSQKNVLYLILLHFIGYGLIKGVFTLFGVSGSKLNNLTVLIEGIIIALFLTILTYKFFNSKIKQNIDFSKNTANKLMIILIIIHIFAGYVGIMFIQDEFSKQTTSIALAKYYNALFSFNTNAYVYLLPLKYITLTHLLLGFLFLALLPHTKVIEDIITIPQALFNRYFKRR